MLVALGSLALGCAGGSETTAPSSAPYVTAATPAEGATDVDAGIDTLSITFSEVMRTTAGTLSIDGGATLGTPSWDGQTLSVPVEGLSGETAYRVVLTGFVDLTGTALDGAPYLGDGALDFTTGVAVDTRGPRVTDADPNEGQVDVARELGAISVTFDEPMDTAVTEASLTGGAAAIDLVGSWDADATTITFPLSTTLGFNTVYHLDLTAYTDAAGNPLDAAPYLGDGILDFTTVGNPDTVLPVVVSSDPPEGAFNLDPDRLVITLNFSEDMDESITELPLVEGTSSPQMVSGVWSDNDTTFTINLTSYLTPGAVYHLDVTGMADQSGNALDATDAYLMDGILDFALADPAGEGCSDPLGMSKATESMGAFTWSIPAASVSGKDGQFACDSTGAGSDVVIRYVKTSDTLANGGQLLHVSAVGGSDDINLEITSGSTCATATVESCLWFKRSWDKFLDVPAGTYWIWVSDDDTSGNFPGATVTIEEIPATAPQAEGEGCFAPYTTASSIYTPPVTSNDPHVWTIPATINSFDIAASSASPGSISCDDHPTYGDIHGVDAVIEFQKTSPTSVLLVEVTNLDPTLTQSDLDVEVLTGCDPLDVSTQSLQCGADSDNFAFTANAGAGPVFIWVATEATGEAFNGAEVAIREFNPGVGETIATAEPLTMSGAITPTSTVGLDRPSCFPTSGNIHWYSYTTTSTLFGVQGDSAGALAVVQGNGSEIACSTDTTQVAIGSSVAAGTTLYIAVESPSTIGSLNLIDQTYTGLAGNATNLNITFPTSAATEYSIAVGTNEVFLGSTAEIWSFPKLGNATAVEHNSTTDGLGTAQLGYSIAFAAGKLFSVDSTTSTTASRLFAVHDELTTTWGPTAWDTPVSYPSQAVYAMTSDGTDLIMVTRSTTASSTLTFLSVPAAAPATPTVIGTNSAVYYAVGVAADASHIYVAGRDSATTTEHLFRFDRTNLSAPPVRLATIDLNITKTNVAVDDLIAAEHVYVRDDSNVLHVVANTSAAPIYLGGLLSNGGTADYAMGMDPDTDTLYLFDSTLAGNGAIVAVQ